MVEIAMHAGRNASAGQIKEGEQALSSWAGSRWSYFSRRL